VARSRSVPECAPTLLKNNLRPNQNPKSLLNGDKKTRNIPRIESFSAACYSDQSVISGTIYYYVVTVVNDTGQESTYSNETRVTVP
jgi:hypothetical protein